MAEVFTLRQHLEATRQELSQALYQHDAACRVIARLMMERDEARAMLMNLRESGMSSEKENDKMEVNQSTKEQEIPPSPLGSDETSVHSLSIIMLNTDPCLFRNFLMRR